MWRWLADRCVPDRALRHSVFTNDGQIHVIRWNESIAMWEQRTGLTW